LFVEGQTGPYNKQKTNTLVNSIESGGTEYQMNECQRSFYPSWNLAARGGCNILWLRQCLEHRLEFSSTSAIAAQVVSWSQGLSVFIFRQGALDDYCCCSAWLLLLLLLLLLLTLLNILVP